MLVRPLPCEPATDLSGANGRNASRSRASIACTGSAASRSPEYAPKNASSRSGGGELRANATASANSSRACAQSASNRRRRARRRASPCMRTIGSDEVMTSSTSRLLPVALGVADVVAARAVRLALHEGRSAAGPRARRPPRRPRRTPRTRRTRRRSPTACRTRRRACATSAIFIVSAVDVVDAYRLFSSTKIAGRFQTAHRLRFSWNGPRLVAPSPKKHTATWSVLRCTALSAAPATRPKPPPTTPFAPSMPTEKSAMCIEPPLPLQIAGRRARTARRPSRASTCLWPGCGRGRGGSRRWRRRCAGWRRSRPRRPPGRSRGARSRGCRRPGSASRSPSSSTRMRTIMRSSAIPRSRRAPAGAYRAWAKGISGRSVSGTEWSSMRRSQPSRGRRELS